MNVTERDRQWFSDDFISGLMLAVALHMFVIMVAFLIGRIVSPMISRSGDMEILKAAVRVDVVGMPKLTLQELKSMEMPTEAPKEEPKPQEAAEVKPTEAPAKPDDLPSPDAGKESKKSLSSLLENYSSKKVKAGKENKKGENRTKVEGLDSLILEGNRISKGTALTGDTSDVASSAFAGYAQTLPDAINRNWRLPAFLKDQNLSCKIRIWIGARGELLKLEFLQPSGNSDFDSRAEAAIRNSAPFSPPPQEAVARMASDGVALGFPLF